MTDNNSADDVIDVSRQPTIRNSCDQCGSQKIRCGKQRPKCSRCAQKGLDCDYGISRRTGKRSAHLPPEDSAPRPEPSIPQSITPTSPTMVPALGLHDDNQWMLSPANSTTNDNNMSYFDPSGGDSMMCNDFGFPSALEDVNPMSLHLTGNSLGAGTSSWGNEHDVIFGQNHMERPRLGSSSQSTSASSYSSRTPPHTILQQETHDCGYVALQALADLHMASQGCLTAAATNNANKNGQTQPIVNLTRDADIIIQKNSDVIERLNSILDCRCSYRQDVLVPIYLCLHKVISWYAAIVDSTSKSAFAQVDCISVKPIFMGNYCLDVSTQRLVRAQIVYRQLKDHVEPVIKRLMMWNDGDEMGHNSLPSLPHSPDSNWDVVPYYQKTLKARWKEIITLVEGAKMG